jgi:hypothetical protein
MQTSFALKNLQTSIRQKYIPQTENKNTLIFLFLFLFLNLKKSANSRFLQKYFTNLKILTS